MLGRRVPASLRRAVVKRAARRCEYCRLAQAGQAATFHLALACVACSLHKGARCTAPDPATGDDAPIFNPRSQHWNEHFPWEGVRVVGLTATGRATAAALQMNRPIVLAIRVEEVLAGRHP